MNMQTPSILCNSRHNASASLKGRFNGSERIHRDLRAITEEQSAVLGVVGGYQLQKVKSRRSSGNVYQARNERGRIVALKAIAGRQQRGRDWAKRFRREAQLAAGLKHPNLVEVHEVGSDRGFDFVAMEYVKGEKLSRWLRKNERLSEEKAAKVILGLADAIGACHAAGLVHRGIKPDNVYLTPGGGAKLIGFGFAKPGEIELTESRSIKETITAQFAAPERLCRGGVADERSDIYSLGALLYTLVTGVHPFNGAGQLSLLHNKKTCSYQAPNEIVPGLSPAIVKLIDRAMAPEPEDRPQTADEFASLLGDYQERIGGYELIAEVGRGTMGSVYRARAVDGRIVALKVLHAHVAENERLLLRFYQEAKLAMELSHANLVPAFEVGQDDGTHFIAMEYVAGPTLTKKLKAQGALPEAQALKIAFDVAKALDELHKRGLLHRDVKPSNILLDADGTARLIDLGLAKQGEVDYDLTLSGHAMGTLQYAPPEQFRNAKTVSQTADIYALGVTLYQMVTGKLPFPIKSTVDLLIRKSRNDYIPPERIAPRISEQTRNLIKSAMHDDSARRPSSAKAFAKATVGYQAMENPLKNRATGNAAPVPMWQVVFIGDDGEVHRVSGTTSQIRKMIRDGKIGEDGRAARETEGIFTPIGSIYELQSPSGATNDRGKTKSSSMLGRMCKYALGVFSPRRKAPSKVAVGNSSAVC